MNDFNFKISCTIDISPPSKDDFLQALQTMEANLDGVATKQQEVAANLQARNAPPGKIETRYKVWTEQLSTLSSEIKKCRPTLAQWIERLPFINDLSIWKEGLQRLTTLSQRSYRLEKANNKLTRFGDSPELRKALSLCKKIIEQCENEKSVSSIQLDAVITKVQVQITQKYDDITRLKKNLSTSIIAIYADTLRFLAYVAKEANASNEGERITNLLKKITAVDAKPLDKNLTTDEEQSLERAKTVELPNNRYFRNGIYAVNWRYPTIYTIVEKMHNSARGLQNLEADIEGKIKGAWQGEYSTLMYPKKEDWQTELTNWKNIITKQREELYNIPFCNEVHSGLHYATSLFTWIDDLEDSIHFLLKTTDDSWLQVGQLHKIFYKQLDLPNEAEISYTTNTYTYMKGLNKCVKTLANVSKLTNENPFFTSHKNQIQTVVTISLARMCTQIFKISSYEQKAQEEILSKTHFSNHLNYVTFAQHPQQKSLLSKRIIHCLHFTEEPFDITLDLLLTMMDTQPSYISYFNRLLQMDEHCKLLIMKYKLAASVDEDKALLKQLCEVYYLLQNALKEQNKKLTKQQELAHFFDYSKYAQQIGDLKRATANNRTTARLQSFLRLTKDMVTELQKKYTSPNYSYKLDEVAIDLSQKVTEPIMYKLLLQALWSLSPESQLQAREMIESVIDTPDINFMNDDIKLLLKALSLHSFLDQMHMSQPNTKLSQLQKRYLPQLMLERLENASYGLTMYSMGTMETALYHLIHIQELLEDPRLTKVIEAFMNGQFYGTWENTVKEYIQFKQSVENIPIKRTSNEYISHNEYLKALQNRYKNEALEANEFKRERYVLKELYREMNNMLITEG